ncbi:MAG: hypothetical protein JWM19_3082, partial [Actinomycetia bacterium]|nr:hypothetical protein [Actinomycetes bacterium]
MGKGRALMSGGFFTSVVPGDGYKPPDIDITVA